MPKTISGMILICENFVITKS